MKAGRRLWARGAGGWVWEAVVQAAALSLRRERGLMGRGGKGGSLNETRCGKM